MLDSGAAEGFGKLTGAEKGPVKSRYLQTADHMRGRIDGLSPLSLLDLYMI